jgi:hypothetical protein
MAENPLRVVMRDWLPEIDFGVMQHGFAPHGRDYVFVLEVAGTYELTLTHVVELHYETRVHDEVWPVSWDDRLTDFATAGNSGGYVWGANWSLAYPGLSALDDDATAAHWSKRLGKAMYAATIETDRFKLSLIFHSVRSRKLSEEDSTVRQVMNPLRTHCVDCPVSCRAGSRLRVRQHRGRASLGQEFAGTVSGRTISARSRHKDRSRDSPKTDHSRSL